MQGVATTVLMSVHTMPTEERYLETLCQVIAASFTHQERKKRDVCVAGNIFPDAGDKSPTEATSGGGGTDTAIKRKSPLGSFP